MQGASTTSASLAAAHHFHQLLIAHPGARLVSSQEWSRAVLHHRPVPTFPADPRFPVSIPGGPTTVGRYTKGVNQINCIVCSEHDDGRTVWLTHHHCCCCRCGEGRVLGRSRLACEDEDECAWRPCLSGGSCFNTQPGDTQCAVSHSSV